MLYTFTPAKPCSSKILELGACHTFYRCPAWYPQSLELGACCPTSILQNSELGACSIFYTCPALNLQTLESWACGVFYTCLTLILQFFGAWGMLYMLHMPNLDPPKSEAWACCIFYTWPTLILQSSKIGACCILYTCPTLFLQILELEACCRFWTCPALIPQIMELGECCISYMPHCPTLILQTFERRAYGPLGQMPYLNPSGGMDSLYWARSMPVNISTLVNVSLLQGQHPYRGTGWVGPARKPLLWRAASRPGTYPLCWEHWQVQYTYLSYSL